MELTRRLRARLPAVVVCWVLLTPLSAPLYARLVPLEPTALQQVPTPRLPVLAAPLASTAILSARIRRQYVRVAPPELIVLETHVRAAPMGNLIRHRARPSVLHVLLASLV